MRFFSALAILAVVLGTCFLVDQKPLRQLLPERHKPTTGWTMELAGLRSIPERGIARL
jgi:hypothetical protein